MREYLEKRKYYMIICCLAALHAAKLHSFKHLDTIAFGDGSKRVVSRYYCASSNTILTIWYYGAKREWKIHTRDAAPTAYVSELTALLVDRFSDNAE